MKMKILFGLLILSVLVNASTIEVCQTGCDYTLIQDAINAAVSGDTIYIHNGTYAESLDISKPLTLEGESMEDVLIECGSGDCIYVHDTQDVTLTYLTLYNSEERNGIYLVNTNSSTVSNNYIYFNAGAGIELEGSFSNEISGNTVEDNDDCAILLFDSSDNEIELNDISNEDEFYTGCGLYLDRSSNNRISNNNISKNDENGLEIWESLNNTLSNNIISLNQENGIYLDINTINSVIIGNTMCYNDQADEDWYDVVIEETGATTDFSENWCDTTSGDYYCDYVCEEAETTTTTSTTTTLTECDLPGDTSPCGTVELSEVIDFINLWAAADPTATLAAVIDLINVWAAG